MYLEGLKSTLFGVFVNLSITVGNFYISDNGKKECKTQKSGVPSLKNQTETPLSRTICGFFVWTSTVKPFFGFCSKKPANPHEY